MGVRRTADDYRRSLQALLPPGVAWTRDPSSNLAKFLTGVGDELARIEGRACDLLDEADPRTTDELLADWEAFAGLPDECSSEITTIEERRNALSGRLANVGGQSAAYFVALAASFGFVIEIVENRWPLAGRARAGDRLTTGTWVFVWEVHAEASTSVKARAGKARAGDPLVSWGNNLLECVIKAAKPAHTKVTFVYDLGLIQPPPVAIVLVAPPVAVFPLKPDPAAITLVVPNVTVLT